MIFIPIQKFTKKYIAQLVSNVKYKNNNYSQQEIKNKLLQFAIQSVLFSFSESHSRLLKNLQVLFSDQNHDHPCDVYIHDQTKQQHLGKYECRFTKYGTNIIRQFQLLKGVYQTLNNGNFPVMNWNRFPEAVSTLYTIRFNFSNPYLDKIYKIKRSICTFFILFGASNSSYVSAQNHMFIFTVCLYLMRAPGRSLKLFIKIADYRSV